MSSYNVGHGAILIGVHFAILTAPDDPYNLTHEWNQINQVPPTRATDVVHTAYGNAQRGEKDCESKHTTHNWACSSTTEDASYDE